MPTGGISLGLLVLRTRDVPRLVAFYRAMGLPFVEEQHGAGPTHFSCELGGLVVEIYPARPGTTGASEGAADLRLGFRVPSIERALAALTQTSPCVRSGPRADAWGRCAVVVDPDGRAVELREVDEVGETGEARR
ncbi:VOC family protein [Chondromyces crocatus]|uniref:Bleomycin resistance protein n=1 Tax=Chondromyces crocatus TaxID=52 RepID=A0A0K1E8U1_CHOCO|nr:VOC family protein [Chondromyces crocatus]AKT37274.1 bleomycin resistance protein [Chondromyces crocatus]